MLSKVICLALDALLSEYVEHVKIKWPNDIYVKDKKDLWNSHRECNYE